MSKVGLYGIYVESWTGEESLELIAVFDSDKLALQYVNKSYLKPNHKHKSVFNSFKRNTLLDGFWSYKIGLPYEVPLNPEAPK